MTVSAKERMQATRYRRRGRLHLAKVEVSESEIQYLPRLGYEARADDPQLLLGSAITAFAESPSEYLPVGGSRLDVSVTSQQENGGATSERRSVRRRRVMTDKTRLLHWLPHGTEGVETSLCDFPVFGHSEPESSPIRSGDGSFAKVRNRGKKFPDPPPITSATRSCW